MDNIPLTINMPLLDGETAAALQQVLYHLLDAFDEQYCYVIERYYQQTRQDQNTL